MCFVYGAITRYGRTFQNGSTTQQLGNSVLSQVRQLAIPRPRTGNATWLLHRHGLASTHFARRYSGCRVFFPFLRVLRCFNSPGSLHLPYVFRQE